ncbi:hypothetical protein CKO40_11850 [Halochromatium glycolicum]|uniref:DUF4112 domain-containing protein n=2 Tax=Halochromatium glycolicum TaxID=85075 RepID=A0AAJ0X9X2_9GAMM|nr:hypothetical protein [Halochromatium glycolicum]
MPLNDDARHGSVAPVEKAAARRRLRRLSHSLDSAIALPGGYRVGWDGAIGLIPGIGDLVGAALSSYIVLEARRLGVPLVVLLHMSINVLIETAVGVIPVVGDLFDFIWKANRRNVQLLESHLDDPGRARGRSSLVVAVMIALMGLVIAALIALALWLLGLLASVL